MIKIQLALFICLYSFAKVYAHHIPSNQKTELTSKVNLNLFYQLNKSFKLHFSNSIEDKRTNKRKVSTYLLGTKIRIHKSIKVSPYISLKKGYRNDEDWRSITKTNYKWLNTNDKIQTHFILDTSPRMILDFLPARTWIGEIRLRTDFNFVNSNLSLKIRPGLTYLHFIKGSPLFSLSFRVETYHPLNYAQSYDYGVGSYNSIMFHLNENLLIGGSVNFYKEYWTPTDEFLSETGSNYKAKEKGKNIALNLTLNL